MAQILLIEPDRILARTYAAALEAAGHQVCVAGEPQAAIDAADDHSPDVVILELMLAAHNGVEFLYEFRSYPEWQAVPVLINSSVPPSEGAIGRELWKQLGVATYHYKPQTSLRKLLQSVEGLVVYSA